MAESDDVGLVLGEAREAMEKSVVSLKRDLQKVRTGRASSALLDGVQVDYYGTATPLRDLANFTVPDARLIVISPYDKGAIGAIERAIQMANLGLTPTNDGKVVRIAVPPLSEERRRDMVKHVHKLAEEHKVSVRDARRDALAMLKDLHGDGLSEDDHRRAQKSVQDLTDEFVKKIDGVSAQKEKEVLEV